MTSVTTNVENKESILNWRACKRVSQCSFDTEKRPLCTAFRCSVAERDESLFKFESIVTVMGTEVLVGMGCRWQLITSEEERRCLLFSTSVGGNCCERSSAVCGDSVMKQDSTLKIASLSLLTFSSVAPYKVLLHWRSLTYTSSVDQVPLKLLRCPIGNSHSTWNHLYSYKMLSPTHASVLGHIRFRSDDSLHCFCEHTIIALVKYSKLTCIHVKLRIKKNLKVVLSGSC